MSKNIKLTPNTNKKLRQIYKNAVLGGSDNVCGNARVCGDVRRIR